MKISRLINMKMPTIVGIFIFISRKISCLAELSLKKSFITSGPCFSNGLGDLDLRFTVRAKIPILHIYIFVKAANLQDTERTLLF